jgi:hypothetical protein
MSEVQKDLEDVSAGLGHFKKSDIWEFCPVLDVKVGEVNFDLTR